MREPTHLKGHILNLDLHCGVGLTYFVSMDTWISVHIESDENDRLMSLAGSDVCVHVCV